MNPTVELVLNHKKSNMRKSEFLMLDKPIGASPRRDYVLTRMVW